MKKLAFFIFLFSMGKAYAQRTGDYNDSRPGNYSNNRVNSYNKPRVNNYSSAENDDYSQIRIVDSTQEIRANITPFKNDPKIKNDRYYYWYLKNVIHSTQGGYNGKLLNGHYVAFYPDKNLKEEGEFKKGLKVGEWKTWNPKGDLIGVTVWSEGIAMPDGQQPFWKKIPFLKKKDEQGQSSKDGDRN